MILASALSFAIAEQSGNYIALAEQEAVEDSTQIEKATKVEKTDV